MKGFFNYLCKTTESWTRYLLVLLAVVVIIIGIYQGSPLSALRWTVQGFGMFFVVNGLAYLLGARDY